MKQKVNRIAFVIDRSGSMRPVWRQAINALNANIAAIRESVKETGQDATVTLIVFDDVVEAQFFNRSISQVKEISEHSFPPRGMTALFDATGESIKALDSAPVGKDEDVTYLVNVLTDGDENNSVKFSQASLKALMKRVQATDRWTLTFLVPPGDRNRLINVFGIPDGNVMEWENSTRGVKSYTDANKAGIKNYFQQRAIGQTYVRTFYANTANLSQRQVKSKLEDVTKDVERIYVDQDMTIQQAVEAVGLTYLKGSAYYLLTTGKKSADKVQNYKQVMIVDKNGKVFAGDSARAMLGLPDYDTRIRPGDHNDFQIFIQSTSFNRKVKKGTWVLYVK